MPFVLFIITFEMSLRFSALTKAVFDVVYKGMNPLIVYT